MMRVFRRLGAVAPLAALALPGAAGAADPPAYDLAGPGLAVTVTRGPTTLPIGAVPELAAGDKVTVRADLPEDQRARYLLVSAFLSGATNPPPKDWIDDAETWKRKDKDRALTLTVPAGARQLALFLVPDTGGATGAIAAAVRGRPGEFVRATQGLNQASLDRSRLDAFVAGVKAQEDRRPEYLRSIAPVLAKSLSIKLNDECLARVVELQAACLTENRDSLVLSDFHSASMAETLIGAPTDLALQLSYTREGGLGYYSPYIAVVRDIARVFGAFNNPQLRYLPTLATRNGERVALLLNQPPSFAKPKSVLVTALPAIDGDSAPRLRNPAGGPLCGARPDLVLPVEGAPLIFSTGYAHTMMLRLANGTDVPVSARADRGGYVLAQPLPAGATSAGGTITGQLHGRWGFDALEGPAYELQFPGAGAWTSRAGTLVAGRDNEVTFAGPAPACIAEVTLRTADGARRPVAWKVTGSDTIAATIPLKDVRPGDLTLELRRHGTAAPATIAAKAFAPASRIDGLTWHRGDRTATLTGQRLDLVAGVDMGDVALSPGTVVREGDLDRLTLTASQPLSEPAGAARVRLADGRTLQQSVTVAAARPGGTILSRSVALPSDGLALAIADDDVLPDKARLTFSVRAADGSRFTAQDAIEVAGAGDARTVLAAGSDVRLAAPDTLVATLDAALLGPTAAGPLRWRIVRGGVTGDWQPLTTLARLPRIEAIDCAGTGPTCTIRGRDLFLLESVGATAVPAGHTSATLPAPRPGTDGRLAIRLRDAPDAAVSLAVPK